MAQPSTNRPDTTDPLSDPVFRKLGTLGLGKRHGGEPLEFCVDAFSKAYGLINLPGGPLLAEAIKLVQGKESPLQQALAKFGIGVAVELPKDMDANLNDRYSPVAKCHFVEVDGHEVKGSELFHALSEYGLPKDQYPIVNHAFDAINEKILKHSSKRTLGKN